MDRHDAQLEIAKQIFKARNDILYFASMLKTHNANTKRIEPFPIHKRYIQELLKLGKHASRLAIYKSRQMLVTWSMCVVLLHELLFSPGAYIGIISKKEEDAGKVLDRIKLLYEYMPLHWRAVLPDPQWYRAKKGINVRVIVRHPNNKPASIIQAYPSGDDQVRMETFSIIYWDEVGFAPDIDARKTYGALRPTIDNGGRLLMSSTPPIDENHFWHQLCEGRYLEG